jgi:hypothetical protein
VRASEAGAHLDSDLLKGGGTDDTGVLQRLLDRARNGRPVHLILDGPSLVSGLDMYGNTTLECTAGGGLYLKDASSRAILRNGHRSRGPVLDEHIEVRGCFLNGNRKHQPSANIRRPDMPSYNLPSDREKDGTFISGLQFLGVNYLSIDRVTLWNTRAFGALIANANYVSIQNVIVDHGGGPNADADEYDMTDGLHFKGPLHFVSIDTIKFRVGDDAIAFNANDFETDDVRTRNDFGPYVGQGPITDVTVNNVIFMPGQLTGIRILSTKERIDRLTISNVVGTVKVYFLNVSHWLNPNSLGNVGQITIDNVAVDRTAVPPVAMEAMTQARTDRVLYGEDNGGDYPLINLNDHIETIKIGRFATKVVDARPLLRIGPDAAIGTVDVDLSAYDPSLLGHVLQVDKGGRVGRLRFALDWQGSMANKVKNPVVNYGGTIMDLEWIGGPAWLSGKQRPPRE